MFMTCISRSSCIMRALATGGTMKVESIIWLKLSAPPMRLMSPCGSWNTHHVQCQVSPSVKERLQSVGLKGVSNLPAESLPRMRRSDGSNTLR